MNQLSAVYIPLWIKLIGFIVIISAFAGGIYWFGSFFAAFVTEVKKRYEECFLGQGGNF